MDTTLPIFSTAQFLVQETRNSGLSQEDRLDRLSERGVDRHYRKLRRLGGSGVLLDCLGAVVHPPRLSVWDHFVVEDHSCGVITQSLKRYYGSKPDIKSVKPGRFALLRSVLKHQKKIRQVVKDSGSDHLTEYIRVLRLLRYYISWMALLGKRKPKAVLLARTNDQKRLALGAAAAESGIPVLVFTVDRVALREPAPFPIALQFCWTRTQMKHLEMQGVTAVQMPVPELRELKNDLPGIQKLKCGFLLNAKCRPEEVNAFCISLFDHFGVQFLSVRPHPGFDIDRLVLDKRAVVCDWRQPLAEYLNSVDLVFSLNSNAIIDALLHGIPVVYCPGMDPYAHDIHGYVKERIVIPFSKTIILPEMVRDFYESEDFRMRWNIEEFDTNGSVELRELKLWLNR